MQEDFRSPDGRLEVGFQCNEVKMSHWICNPRVTFDGAVLLDLWPSVHHAWDGDGRLDVEGRLVLHLRRYPAGSSGFDVRIDPVARTWSVVAGTCPEEMERELGKVLRRV
ncbi:MAG: hypothetical protein IT452_22010 [Planctomycetia bacterium]|nr:hypothetical protein [Planctomycetia bacterium]